MLMDALERSTATEVYHERDPRAFSNYQLLDMPHVKDLIARSRAELVVLKCLMESQKLDTYLTEFAGSRAVWMFRHYDDVVNSMLISFRNQAAQVKRIALDRNSDGWLGECMSDETHELITTLTRKNLDDPSAAAIQWYFRNKRFFEQNFETDDRVDLMHYDRLVVAPNIEVMRLFEANDLKYTRSITKYINARSLGKRRSPALRDDVRELCESLYQEMISIYAEKTQAQSE